MLKAYQRVMLGVAACVVLTGTSLAALAQTPRPMTCADFTHNANGTWTPNVRVTLGGVSMGPGVTFSRGIQFGGVDLAAELDQQCSH